MAIRFVMCTECNGLGKASSSYTYVPLLADDHTKFDPAQVKPRDDLDLSQPFEIVKCPDCNGLKGPDGRSYARGGRNTWDYQNPYKTPSTLKAGLTSGKAFLCKKCTAIGELAQVPSFYQCFQCHGMGSCLAEFAPGDVIPVEFDLYNNPLREALQGYADAVTIVIRRHSDSVLTAGAALLGLGTLWTVGDGGRMLAEADDAIVTTKIRDHLAADRTQMVKLADKETRTVAEVILVTLTTNGYAVSTAASRESTGNVLLPPTYTADVLNAPYER